MIVLLGWYNILFLKIIYVATILTTVILVVYKD